jgi:hypothetical protein
MPLGFPSKTQSSDCPWLRKKPIAASRNPSSSDPSAADFRKYSSARSAAISSIFDPSRT